VAASGSHGTRCQSPLQRRLLQRALHVVHNVLYTLFMLLLPLVLLAGLNVRLIREVKALGRRRLETKSKI